MNVTRLAILLASALPLAACAAAPDRAYPSLAIRDAERVSGQYPAPTGTCVEPDGASPVEGTFQPGPPAPPPAPPPSLSNDVVERVDQLLMQAREDHADFERAVPDARPALRGAGAVGSKSWGRAQVAYANLRSLRARTAIALADLDTLAATRAVAGEPVDQIVRARNAVAEMIEQEDAVLNELAPR